MAMRALVTGGGGFLGKKLVRQLIESGNKVRVFELPGVDNSEESALGAEIVKGDLRSRKDVEKACRGMDAVFHVASLASPWGPFRLFYDINVMGTEHIISGCRQNDVPRLVYTSSPSAIFDGTNHRGLDENVPYPARFTSYYGRTKAMAERLVLDAGRPGLITCAIRPHAMWGPGDNHLFPRILSRALSGRLSIVGSGKNKVSVTHVEDAARAHILAAQSKRCAGKAYFVNQDKPVLLWELVCTTLEAAGVKPPTRKVPRAAAWAVASACEALWSAVKLKGEPFLTRYMVDELTLDHYYSNSRAAADLGYRPQITTETGRDTFVDWIRNTLLPRLKIKGK